MGSDRVLREPVTQSALHALDLFIFQPRYSLITVANGFRLLVAKAPRPDRRLAAVSCNKTKQGNQSHRRINELWFMVYSLFPFATHGAAQPHNYFFGLYHLVAVQLKSIVRPFRLHLLVPFNYDFYTIEFFDFYFKILQKELPQPWHDSI